MNEVEYLRDKFPYGHKEFIPMCLREVELHSQKNLDYAFTGDPLGNFKRVSEALKKWGMDMPPSLVALTYMMKQVDAAGNMLGRGYDGKVEGIEGRLQDVSIYAKLIALLYAEEVEQDKKGSAPIDSSQRT